MFIAVLFQMPNWKQAKYPLTEDQRKSNCTIYTQWDTTQQQKEPALETRAQTNLEDMILNERTPTQGYLL